MYTIDWQIIGKRLAAYRKQLGLTQAQVAEEANVSEHTCSKMERGACSVNATTLIKICSVLRLSVDELIQEEEEDFNLTEDLHHIIDSFSPREQRNIAKYLQLYLKTRK